MKKHHNNHQVSNRTILLRILNALQQSDDTEIFESALFYDHKSQVSCQKTGRDMKSFMRYLLFDLAVDLGITKEFGAKAVKSALDQEIL
jgi:hypothetical protein